MASLASCRRAVLAHNAYARALSTAPPTTTPPSPALTHYKITLRRSALSLGDKIKGTLEALGIHKRNQTVYHEHSPDIAGKILKVKELVEVENVPASAIRNKWEQRQERKAVRGYQIVGSKRDRFLNL